MYVKTIKLEFLTWLYKQISVMKMFAFLIFDNAWLAYLNITFQQTWNTNNY